MVIITDTMYKFIDPFMAAVSVFFLIYLIGYSTFIFLSTMFGSVHLYTKKQKNTMKDTMLKDYYVPVSIIVPAYNEEVTVVETVRSLLALDYKSYEILVVDDGSKDDTAAVLIDAFNMKLIRRPIRRQLPCQPEREIYETEDEKVSITLIRKFNGGKADALNMGINACRFPYFICMDADSALQHDSLIRIVAPTLEHDNVVAVGGAVRPSNGVTIEHGRVTEYRLPRNILACMQSLEYDRSFLASRIFFDMFNGTMIISGAFGLFKKDFVIAAGGYDKSTVGEDMELVVKLHEYCGTNDIDYKICYASDAICWSQAPERLKDLMKQRKRWQTGLLQSMNAHKRMFMNPRYGIAGSFSYLYFLIYELFSPIIEIFGFLTMVFCTWLGFVNLPFMIFFLIVYAVFGSVMTLTAFFARVQTLDLKVRFTDALKALGLCFFEVTFLRFVIAWVRLTAILGYRKGKTSWGSIQRKKMQVN